MKPIIFSGPDVRAILDGTKTQTRRVVKPQPKHTDGGWTTLKYFGDGLAIECGPDYPDGDEDERHCPYGVPGDRLWVRETCHAEQLGDDPATYPQHILDAYVEEANGAAGLGGVRYAADGWFEQIENSQAASDAWCGLYAYRGGRGLTVPSVHMPRWASRITLEVADVRVERVQDISSDDCFAEGIDDQSDWYTEGEKLQSAGSPVSPERYTFASLWNHINGKHPWDSNPWIWKLEFRRVDTCAPYRKAGPK